MAAISEIERFLRENNIPPSRFGREVSGDSSLVIRIRSGAQLREGLIARVDKYMAEYTPPPPTVEETQAKFPTHTAETQAVGDACIERGTTTLLKALWREHAGILAYLGAPSIERICNGR